MGSSPGLAFSVQLKASPSYLPKWSPPPFVFLLYLLVYFQPIAVGGLIGGHTLARDTIMYQSDGAASHSQNQQHTGQKAPNS